MRRIQTLTLAALLACPGAVASARAQSGRIKHSDPPPAPTPEQKPPADGSVYGVGDGGELSPRRDSEGVRIYSGRDVTRRAVIRSRPKPSYPKDARRNNTHGVVRIRLVLAASGKVESVTVVRGLPDGLTEEAIKAARKIEFEPALKDGVKVSQYAIVEYNFNIY